MTLRLFLPLVMIFVLSCHRERSLKVDIGTDIPVVSIKDYGRALFSLDPKDLKGGLLKIQDDYSFFLGGNLDDTSNLVQLHDFITDPFMIEIAQACKDAYPDLDAVEKSLGKGLAYYRHYFPKDPLPVFYAYISGLNHQVPVDLADSVMIIGLDMYLGPESEFYSRAGIPKYRTQRCTADYIAVDCMARMARVKAANQMNSEDLLGYMLFEGKMLYLTQSFLADYPDHMLIYYSPKQYDWCMENEGKLWSFIVKNELLYSTEINPISKLMIDGPFTSAFSRESPSRLGWFVGWQIVKSYMDSNPDVTIEQLAAETDARKIFTLSGYKPRM